LNQVDNATYEAKNYLVRWFIEPRRRWAIAIRGGYWAQNGRALGFTRSILIALVAKKGPIKSIASHSTFAMLCFEQS
jgi:hypothetical protein